MVVASMEDDMVLRQCLGWFWWLGMDGLIYHGLGVWVKSLPGGWRRPSEEDKVWLNGLEWLLANTVEALLHGWSSMIWYGSGWILRVWVKSPSGVKKAQWRECCVLKMVTAWRSLPTCWPDGVVCRRRMGWHCSVWMVCSCLHLGGDVKKTRLVVVPIPGGPPGWGQWLPQNKGSRPPPEGHPLPYFKNFVRCLCCWWACWWCDSCCSPWWGFLGCSGLLGCLKQKYAK